MQFPVKRSPAPHSPYRIPQMRRIGKGDDTAALYTAEFKTDLAFAKSARALEQFLQSRGLLPETVDHYRDVRPEAILAFLDSQDHRAAIAACFAFLSYVRTEVHLAYTHVLIDWVEQRSIHCPACGKEGTMPTYLGQAISDDDLQRLIAAYRDGQTSKGAAIEDSDQVVIDRLETSEVISPRAPSAFDLGASDAESSK